METSRSTGGKHRLFLAISALIVVALALPAAAGIDQSPNAIPFGPSICEDGREGVDLAYTPTDPAPVGMVSGTNEMGTSKSLTVIALTGADPLGDHVVLEVLYDRPGKGLDRNTTRCVFPLEGTPFWLAAEINFNN